MKLSTVCPLPAGSAIFRDVRAWHGGTPNLSHEVRAMPNIEYLAPWFRNDVMQTSMPYDEWVTLSPHARALSRIMSARGRACCRAACSCLGAHASVRAHACVVRACFFV